MNGASYVRPRVTSFSAPQLLEALGPALAGYKSPPPPCQTTCRMCANYCGFMNP
jgi:hypothetical protein